MTKVRDLLSLNSPAEKKNKCLAAG